MNRYILLRNNKEEGPFTEEELLKMGLNTFDLIWIEGKSAAWRYPGEIDAFKKYVEMPEMEEDNRFQIARTEQKKNPEIFTPKIEEPAKPVPEQNVETEKYQAKTRQSVFVTMPQPRKKVEETKTSKPAQITKPVIIADTPRQEKTVLPEKIVETPKLSTQYSQPLDEIKEEYVKRLYDRKDKLRKKQNWKQAIRIAAGMLLLIAIGSIAGYFLYPVLKNENNQAHVIDQPPENNYVDETPADAGIENTVYQEQPEETQEIQVAPRLNPESVQKPSVKEVTENNNQAENTPQIVYEKKPVEEFGGERRKVTRESNTENITAAKQTTTEINDAPWRQRVKVSTNAYTRVAFGGIRNLQLTVTNQSDYRLDDVVVELKYIKPSEQPLKVENIRFKNINAGEAMTLKIPDSNRGIKIEYKIVNIASEQAAELASN